MHRRMWIFVKDPLILTSEVTVTERVKLGFGTAGDVTKPFAVADLLCLFSMFVMVCILLF